MTIVPESERNALYIENRVFKMLFKTKNELLYPTFRIYCLVIVMGLYNVPA